MKRFFSALILTGIFLLPYTVIDIPCSSYSYDISYLCIAVLFFLYLIIKKRIKRAVKNIILVTLSITFTIFIFDLLLRSCCVHFIHFNPSSVYRKQDTLLKDNYIYDHNIQYTGSAYGDLAAIAGKRQLRQIRNVSFITDTHGFRNTSEQTPEIIVIGDSFGAGEGISQELCWVSHLSHMLNKNIYNLSVDGSSPWQQFMQLHYHFPRLHKNKQKLTVLWLIFDGNDLDDEYHEYFSPQTFSQTQSLYMAVKMFRKRSVITYIAQKILYSYFNRNISSPVIQQTYKNKKEILFWTEYVQRMKRSSENVLQHHNYQLFETTFSKMSQFSIKNNISVHVIFLPSKEQIYYNDNKIEQTGFSMITEQLCQKYSFNFLDLTAHLDKRSKTYFNKYNEILFWYDDTHWNTYGHYTAAHIIYEQLFK